MNSPFDRRTFVTGVGLSICSLTFPGCKDTTLEHTKLPQSSSGLDSEEKTREASNQQKISLLQEGIEALSLDDKPVGAIVEKVLPQQAQNLLIVVRFAHLTPEAQAVISPSIRSSIQLSSVQTRLMLEYIVKEFPEAMVSGDSLLAPEADAFYQLSQFLRGATSRLGALTKYRSVDAALASSHGFSENQNSFLQKLTGRDKALFDSDLERYHNGSTQMTRICATQPLIAVAHASGLKLTPLENKELHARSVRYLQDPNSREDFSALSELREDAILDTIISERKKTGRDTTVTILCMGALHRFTDRINARVSRTPAERFALVECNPLALPDELPALRRFLEGKGP